MAANYFMIRERDTVELHGFEDVEKKLFIRFLHNNDLAFVALAIYNYQQTRVNPGTSGVFCLFTILP